MTNEQRKLALMEEIERVFDGVERGEGTTFYEGTALDDGGFPEEMAAARAKDTESRWQDVPDETFRKNYSTISFLDPEGFRYYVPALMVWYLRHMGTKGPDANSNLFGSLIFYLTLSDDLSLGEYQLNRFQAFSRTESRVIAWFLQFDAERERSKESEWRKEGIREMLEKGKSQSEIDAHIKYFDDPVDAQIALDKYWGQFLAKD